MEGDMSIGKSVVPARSRDNEISGTDAEKDIKNGDILLWRGNYSISKLFARITGSWYTHAAFVICWGDNPMVLEAGAFSIHALPFRETVSKYDGQVDCWRLTPEKSLDVASTTKEATSDLGLPFGYLSVIQAIAYRSIKLKIFPTAKHRGMGMFCAEYVSRCFNKGGVDLATNLPDRRTFPQDIAKSEYLQFHKHIHTPKEARLTRALRKLKALIQYLVRAVRGTPPVSVDLVVGQASEASPRDSALAHDGELTQHHDAHPGDSAAP
jgi:hypothetical protein